MSTLNQVFRHVDRKRYSEAHQALLLLMDDPNPPETVTVPYDELVRALGAFEEKLAALVPPRNRLAEWAQGIAKRREERWQAKLERMRTGESRRFFKRSVRT